MRRILIAAVFPSNSGDVAERATKKYDFSFTL